jgi:glycerol-3-phosphate acyltransferase PlsX
VPDEAPFGHPGADAQRLAIAVDAMGGDHAPEEIVAGAVAAAAGHGVSVVLAGPPAQLRALLPSGLPPGLVRIAPAEDSIGMGEGALASRRRPRSSIAVACQLVRRGQAGAVVSAGSTGAIVATARLRLRSVPGLIRPALTVVLPTRPNPTFLVDAGAIADPKPEMLLQFAQLGVAYAQIAHGIDEPQVGLLTIGTEPGKGNRLARRAYELLTDPPPHGALPDGFTGNVALKTLEGAATFAAGQLRAVFESSRAARLGALLQRPGLRELATRMDTESYGGAALVGLEGTVVIAHGASTARGITSACLLAAELVKGQITEKIRERLGPGRGAHFLRRT